jgi:Kef-type K+ transport system membrane component KefB
MILGPSLLGWFWPEAQAWIFPAGVLPVIDVLGNLGLLVFMFLLGLELDVSSLRRHSRIVLAVSQSSILLPLVGGGALAFLAYPSLAPPGVDRLPFAHFIAVSRSITAFPVLARILADRGLHRTPLGNLAIACAAVADISAWCLLALVAAVTRAESPWGVLVTIAETFGSVAVMLLVIRPVIAYWAGRTRVGSGTDSESFVLVVLFSGLSLAALSTDRIGIHPIFGAFLFGMVMPRNSPGIERAAGHMVSVAMPLLLPLFFVVVGLRTDIGSLGAQAGPWLWFAAILAVAVIGKWGGSTAAARLCGRPWRESLALGALMNCRGVTELVVLSIGLDLGILGADLFAILVLMALVTTATTTPAMKRLWRPDTLGTVRAIAPSEGGSAADVGETTRRTS